MIMLKVDSTYTQQILDMQTAVLCYTQLLNNSILTAWTLSIIPLRNLPVNKRLRKFNWISLIEKISSKCTKICLCHKLQTFGSNWPLFFFTTFIGNTVIKKKLWPKIIVKNQKKIEFSVKNTRAFTVYCKTVTPSFLYFAVLYAALW